MIDVNFKIWFPGEKLENKIFTIHKNSLKRVFLPEQ